MSIFPRYEKYKDSGIEWLGEIPAHWQLKRLKYVAQITYGISPHEKTYNENGIGTVLVNGPAEYSESEFGYTRAIKWTTAPTKFAQKGSLLFCLRGSTTGRLNLCHEDLSIGRGCAALNALIDKDFFIQSVIALRDRIVETFKGSTFPSITSSDLDNYIIAVPPEVEQIRVAQFLSHKIAQVNQAIEQKEKLIELLQERHQLHIHNAVTRGLNPDAPMRNSGIEWIGEAPTRWKITRVKNVFRLIIEPAPRNNDFELLSVYTDIGVKPRRELEERGNKASTTDGYWLVKKGDIIVNKLLAWMGAIGVSKYDGVTSPAYDILRGKVEIESEYFHYLFRTARCVSELRKHSRGIMDMRLRLYFDKFGDVMIPLPPLSEQREIVSYIEAITQKTETAIACKQNEIEKLKEFKATLINSAVTGKIKVV